MIIDQCCLLFIAFIVSCSFPHPESGDVFAFLEYTERLEEEQLRAWKAKADSLKAKVQKKKEKAKSMYRSKYKRHLEKLKEKYRKKCRVMERDHEKSIRRKYLMGSSDKKFSLEEWEKEQQSTE